MQELDFADRTELSAARIDSLITRNRTMFEHMTGVPFLQQQEFHEALARVVATGEVSVDQLIHSLLLDRRSNGSSSADESWTSADLGVTS